MKAASRIRGSMISKEKKGSLSISSSEVGGKDVCSPMLTAQAAATGVSLIHGGCYEVCPPVHEEYEAEFNLLHMNWVLVDDAKGNHRAQVQWVIDR